jgi:hypothetical protein
MMRIIVKSSTDVTLLDLNNNVSSKICTYVHDLSSNKILISKRTGNRGAKTSRILDTGTNKMYSPVALSSGKQSQ